MFELGSLFTPEQLEKLKKIKEQEESNSQDDNSTDKRATEDNKASN